MVFPIRSYPLFFPLSRNFVCYESSELKFKSTKKKKKINVF